MTGSAATPSPIAAGTVALTATATDAGGTTAAAEWFEGADPGAGNGTADDGRRRRLRRGRPRRLAGRRRRRRPRSRQRTPSSVRARDAAGNWGAPVATTLVVDRAGPVASAVTATPSPVGSGTVTLSATAADAASTVAGAEWFEGADPGAGNGTADDRLRRRLRRPPPRASRPASPPPACAAGSHTLSVRARDAAGQLGRRRHDDPVGRPHRPASRLGRDGRRRARGSCYGHRDRSGDRRRRRPTVVAGAEWFEGADPGAGNGTAMAAADGAFGAPAEGLTASIPTAGMGVGAHVLTVRARDAVGNWGPGGSVTLTVSASNAIFSDGFESGGLGAWSLASGAPARIAASAAARRDGAYGMQAKISGNTPSYVQDATPASESSYVASFALNPNGVTSRPRRRTSSPG